MKLKKKINLADVYFIYADNILVKNMDYYNFKALINFYSLLYDNVIIPDTFFINNEFLVKFMKEDRGLEYVEKGIIVPSVRSGISSLGDIYKRFEANGTLSIDKARSKELLGYLEALNLDSAITWNLTDVGEYFENQVLCNLEGLNILEEDKKRWADKLFNVNKEGALTRQIIRDTTKITDFKETTSFETINSYVDVIYNFNLPSFLGTSAAYPENLVKNGVTPEKVYFNSNVSRGDLTKICKKEYLNTWFFNTGVLANLNLEQIVHIRGLNEYKKFVKGLEKPSDENNMCKLQEGFVDYLFTFDAELPKIISLENKKLIEKTKKKLSIMSLGQDSMAGDGAGFAIDLALDGIASFIGAKLLGKTFKILAKPILSSTERTIKMLELEGKGKIKEIETRDNIYDAIKQFSLNSIEQ
ncbi:hypothetical protein [Clostridium tunisiense]|uniref:hypothetical protein n=1 Tax=Clostridium tunisiense TaxID=219748 RepID=UPI0002FB4547|nr:hypothetical protein [Clostridium tunisiense]